MLAVLTYKIRTMYAPDYTFTVELQNTPAAHLCVYAPPRPHRTVHWTELQDVLSGFLHRLSGTRCREQISCVTHNCLFSNLDSKRVCIYSLPFLDPEGGSQNATLVVHVVLLRLILGIISLKIPKAFLTRSSAQRNFAHTFVLIFPSDLPSQIFKLIPN